MLQVPVTFIDTTPTLL